MSAPVITTVIVPFHRDVAMLRRVLEPFRHRAATTELLVAADGPVEHWEPVADEFGAVRIHWPTACGPAVARNRAASVAAGRYLLFVDGDVIAERGVVDRVERFFDANPGAVGVFGAYDEAPEAPGFMSQYRNLQHRFVHLQGAGEARTFWAGLGAVAAGAFRAIGGYDERFRRPSVEDIDLGYRLTRTGGRIVIDPGLNGKHLKRWTVRSVIVSDVRDRGVPWTQLIQRYGMSADLNLGWALRASVVCAYVCAICLVAGVWMRWAWWVLPLPLAGLLALNAPYYGYFLRLRGALFAGGAVVAHAVHHLCNGVSYVVGRALYTAGRRFGVTTPWTLPIEPAAEQPIPRWSPDGASAP
ncbi:MAG: glycosyltransferase [Vicinamibacterales bacterium]